MSERLPARLRALATELTKLREAAGLTTRQAAAKLGMSIATLNRLENAKRTATVADVSALLAIYGVIGAERKRIMAMVEEVNPIGWHGVQLTRGWPALANFEAEATGIVNFAPSIIPGLLQTPDYARAVIGLGGIAEADLPGRVAERMNRQQVLTKLVGPTYLAVLDEAALRRAYGGSAAMVEQIHWLIDMAKQPNLTIQVIPFRHGGYRNPGGHFSLLDFAKAPSIVYVEHEAASGFLDHPEDTSLFRQVATTLTRVALGSADSVNFMARMAADFERS
ncbi:helix-turn-helix domain-containing protein [Actinokineospora sp.]|uniref:helix-turn-helix domain-containing protein n=1 Tax=Actinokineospora sp. TaxID=1872133 RepID=UPI003D6BA318